MVYPAQKIKNSRQPFCHRVKYGIAWSCDKTSLHGFHYITSKESSLFTKLFFAVVSCCSLTLCTYLIYLQLAEHQQQSVMTTVRSTAFPVWKVRFPSVTICNFNLVYKDNIKNMLNVVRSHNLNEAVFNDMLYNLSALLIYDDLSDMSSYEAILEGLRKAGYNTDRLMAELAHPCISMVKKCFWQSEEVQCARIFESVKTSQGYCCAFNYYGTLDTAVNLDDPQKLHYQYVGGAGPTLGLQLILDVEEDQYIASIKPSYGINVLVQDGFDYPDMDLIANTVLSTEELTISVTPRVYVSTNNVKQLHYKRRNCLFEDEGHLEWTSTYSYKTCISQCRVQAILEYCDCVPYYYPIKSSTRFCTLLDVPCLRENRYKYNALENIDDFFTEKDAGDKHKRMEKVVQCNCYPQCNEQIFDFHVDRAKATPMMGFEFSNVSIVNVYYTTIGCIQTERDVYFTWDRILASIGGIFGLCLGGSVISILECFYFFGKHITDCKSVEPGSQSTQPIQTKVYEADFKLYNKKNYIEKNYNNSKKPILVNGFKY